MLTAVNHMGVINVRQPTELTAIPGPAVQLSSACSALGGSVSSMIIYPLSLPLWPAGSTYKCSSTIRVDCSTCSALVCCSYEGFLFFWCSLLSWGQWFLKMIFCCFGFGPFEDHLRILDSLPRWARLPHQHPRMRRKMKYNRLFRPMRGKGRRKRWYFHPA